MKKQIALFILTLFTTAIFAQIEVKPSGSGTEADPYLIANLENLYWLSQTDSIWGDTLYFEQTADIDASATKHWDSGNGFSPLGIVVCLLQASI